MELLTLLWFSCSLYQMKQESNLLQKSVTALVLIPPSLISRAAQIKDRPFSCVRCGPWLRGCGQEQAAQSLLSARAVLSNQPSSQGQCQAAQCCWKNAPCQSPEKWNNSQHRAGGKNNHGLKTNTMAIALGMQTHTCTPIFVKKKGNNTQQLWMHHLSQLHVSTLLHYGCWVSWSCGTLELKSLSR